MENFVKQYKNIFDYLDENGIDKKLDSMINNFKKKMKFNEDIKTIYNYPYKRYNLKQLYSNCINLFFFWNIDISKLTKYNTMNTIYNDTTLILKDSNLKKKNEVKIHLKIEIGFSEITGEPLIKFFIPIDSKKKLEMKSCYTITWVPRIKILYLNFLLYNKINNVKIKLDPENDCYVENFPKEKGKFLMNLTEDIAKSFNCKLILLEDASKLYINNKLNTSLSLYYIKKYGYSYYMKYGFQPVKEKNYPSNLNFFDYLLIGYKIDIDEEFIDNIKKKLKDIPLLDKKNIKNWISKTKNLTNKIDNRYYVKYLN